MKFKEGFATRLKDAITDSQYDVPYIAKRTGISKSSIYNWTDIAASSTPNAAYLAELCKILHVSADYLLFGKRLEENEK